MQYKDYYEILGVDRKAGKEEIKKSYRRLARKYHPDVSKEANAEERFKEINEAYEVVGDAEKRTAYDELGSNWQNGERFNPPPGWEGGVDYSQFTSGRRASGGANFSDFFESMFGGGGFSSGQQHYQQQTRKPPSQTASITVGLEDVFSGGVRRIRLSNGTSVEVKIPKGIEEGKKIRLSGKASNGGDLLLKINIDKHAKFQRDGKNVSLNLSIAPWEAALGGSVEVETLAGKLKLKIPPGSQSGQKMRLKGRGLPGNPAGDQFVVLQILVPPASTDDEKLFYEQMREKFDWNPR